MTAGLRIVPCALLLAGLVACGGASRAPVEPAPLPPPPLPPVAAPRATVMAPPPSDPLTTCTRLEARFDDAHANRRARPLTAEEDNAVQEATVFIRDHADAAAPDVRAQLAQKEYLRARTFFEAHHWGDAAVSFRTLALNRAESELGRGRVAALPGVAERAGLRCRSPAPGVLRRDGA